MKVIPNRSFLVRQDDVEGGGKKDVFAKAGQKMEMSEREAVKFWGSLNLSDSEKKTLNIVARKNGYTRLC